MFRRYRNTALSLLTIGCVFVAGVAQAQFSPWLAPEGTFNAGISYTNQSFTSFWLGTQKTEAPFGEITQHSYIVPFEYGLSDNMSIGGTFGYTSVEADEPTFRDESGLDDTYIGLRYNLYTPEGDTLMPHISAKVDAIIRGTYDTGFPSSPGDGGSGAQVVLGAGNDFGNGLSLITNIGYRNRNKNIPSEMLYYASLYYSFMDNFTATAGYRHQQSQSGLDIGGPGWAGQFPQLKENSGAMEFSLGYTLSDGTYLGAFYAETVDGRNTGENEYFGFSVSTNL